MGIFQDIQKILKKPNPRSQKSFNEEFLIGDNGIFNGSISQGSKNPITENIFNTISNDISLLKYKHVLSKDDDYEEYDDSAISWILKHRTNDLQSPTEFFQSFTYNLVKFGNAIAIPIYSNSKETTIKIDGVEYVYETSNGRKIQKLENIDVSQMQFGFGYDKDDNNKKYLVYKKNNKEYAGLFGIERYQDFDNELYIIPYEDVIHIRYVPANIFKGDKYNIQNWNVITDLVNANLNSLISLLNSSGKIKGILKLTEGQLGADSKKKKLQSFTNAFLKNNPSQIAVLDMHDEFTALQSIFETVSKDDINNNLDLLYKMFGVNSKIIDGTYTSAEYSAYFHHTLSPIIAKIHDELNYKLLSKHKIIKGEKIIVYKTLTVGSSVDEIVNLINKGIYNGVLTPNELRDMLGLPPYKEGDNFYSNLNAVQIGQAPDTQGILEPREGEERQGTSEVSEEVAKN